MRESLALDKKLLAYLILILMLLISIGLIWRHYDIELKAIEKQRSELKAYSN